MVDSLSWIMICLLKMIYELISSIIIIITRIII